MAALDAGRDIVTDIDWQGTQQLAGTVRGDLVSVFILPPSVAALEDRLQAPRPGQLPRWSPSAWQKSADEMSHWPEYDYVVVNDDFAESVRELQAILAAERVRRERQVGLAEFVNRLRGGV